VLARAAVLGPVVAFVVAVFIVVLHHLQTLLWEDLPDRLGLDGVPWWWVFGVLTLGAVLTALAVRLPGAGGHSPLDGFAFDIGPRQVLSVLAAALASLSFGAALGPEAPALAIGTALGVLAATGRGDPRPAAQQQRTILMLAGGAAAFGLVLGNPLAVALFLLEATLLSRRDTNPVAFVPVAVSLGLGYLVQVGVADWPGIGETVLAIPGLDPYPDVQPMDLLLAVPLAVAVAALVAQALHNARRFRSWGNGRPVIVPLVLAALGIAAVAVTVEAISGEPVDVVLFSGQSALGSVLAATSVGTLLLIALAKAVAYALSLGGGFRGGQIFPAIYLGAVLASAAALLVPSSTVQGLLPAALAAGAAATLRAPFSAALLAVLLTASSGSAVTAPALLGSVAGMLTASALDRLRRVPAVPASDDSEADHTKALRP
jgi:H+/Cl- antiporter ClcA